MAPRRSVRLHAQTHSSEQGAGIARRRRHPQIQPSADGAGVNPRRSPRLHPQIHSSEEVAAGMARRTGTSPPEAAASLPDENARSEQRTRVACLRPQIQPRDDDVGVTSPHSPPLHPHIHDSDEEGAEVARLVRSTSLAAADASLPGDDDMLREILLRLPPQPSSLPRASAVCKRWLGLLTDPKFHSQFYAHHRKPPLLGVFSCGSRHGIVFDPTLAPPDRIPPDSFSLGSYSWSSWSLGCRVPMRVLDCRHGLLLLRNESGTEVVVCDPITGEQLRLAIPPELRTLFLSGAVLCAASDLDHVHGDCHSSPFKLVLVSSGKRDGGDLACVYSSETGVWWGSHLNRGSLLEFLYTCDPSW